MPSILIVGKSGIIKETVIKTYNVDELYKKAGFKSSVDFILHHTFDILLNNVQYSISLFGKTNGKANQENKYDFPPPVDNLLFFGNCLLVNYNKETGKQLPLLSNEWEMIYEKLFGGFEEICESDDDDDDDESGDDIDPSSLTKEGYLKDDFIVDEDEDEENEDDEEDEDEDEDDEDDEDDDADEANSDTDKVVKKIKKIKNKYIIKKETKVEKKLVKSNKKTKSLPKNTTSNVYLDCSSELTAEEYLN